MVAVVAQPFTCTAQPSLPLGRTRARTTTSGSNAPEGPAPARVCAPTHHTDDHDDELGEAAAATPQASTPQRDLMTTLKEVLGKQHPRQLQQLQRRVSRGAAQARARAGAEGGQGGKGGRDAVRIAAQAQQQQQQVHAMGAAAGAAGAAGAGALGGAGGVGGSAAGGQGGDGEGKGEGGKGGALGAAREWQGTTRASVAEIAQQIADSNAGACACMHVRACECTLYA